MAAAPRRSRAVPSARVRPWAPGPLGEVRERDTVTPASGRAVSGRPHRDRPATNLLRDGAWPDQDLGPGQRRPVPPHWRQLDLRRPPAQGLRPASVGIVTRARARLPAPDQGVQDERYGPPRRASAACHPSVRRRQRRPWWGRTT